MTSFVIVRSAFSVYFSQSKTRAAHFQTMLRSEGNVGLILRRRNPTLRSMCWHLWQCTGSSISPLWWQDGARKRDSGGHLLPLSRIVDLNRDVLVVLVAFRQVPLPRSSGGCIMTSKPTRRTALTCRPFTGAL